MAGNREIIEALHFVGAADGFIARQFQFHFLRLGLRGGVIGGGAAIVLFLALGFFSRQWTTSAGGEQAEALFGSFSLGWGGVGAIAVISLGVGPADRLHVARHRLSQPRPPALRFFVLGGLFICPGLRQSSAMLFLRSLRVQYRSFIST